MRRGRGAGWRGARGRAGLGVVRRILTGFLCDPASAAVSPSVVVTGENNAPSAVGLILPPCGVRARLYPDPAVLGAGLGENIVSISML